MKLSKHDSVPFHEKAMKLKFILPFYFILASITFCSRKVSDDRDNQSLKQEQALTSVTTPAEISGTLELDTVTNTIYADLWLQVSNHNYRFAHDFMPLQSDGKFKGVAFRYYDTVNNAPDSGKDVAQMHAVFNFTNDNNWAVNDTVRVMTLDEETKSTFDALKPYFVKRMDHFMNTPCDYDKLVEFNNAWNTTNPANKITTGMGNPETEGTGTQRFIPKLTKDDGILSLKLKR